jgi:hypothetical protein
VGPTKKGQNICFFFKFYFIEKSPLNQFIHFQLQSNAPMCLQIPSKVKVTLGKSRRFLSVILKYLSDVTFLFLFFFLPPNLGKCTRFPAIQLNKLVRPKNTSFPLKEKDHHKIIYATSSSAFAQALCILLWLGAIKAQ